MSKLRIARLLKDVLRRILSFFRSSRKISLGFIRSVSIALMAALLFRSFVFEPFHIPSASMRGTLVEGDYIFVSKYSYGYSRYSFPFAFPLFEGRIMYKQPERGDVVVFRPKKDSGISYIKRIIGLPGDKIKMKNGLLYVNHVEVPKVVIEDYLELDPEGNHYSTKQYQETLDNGKTYRVLDSIKNSIIDDTPLYEVPEGHFFVMGDNRDNSRDSRFLYDIGYIPVENLVGRAELIFLSFSNSSSILPFPFNINFNRFWIPI